MSCSGGEGKKNEKKKGETGQFAQHLSERSLFLLVFVISSKLCDTGIRASRTDFFKDVIFASNRFLQRCILDRQENQRWEN